MKYAYREECIISDRDDKVVFILIIVLLCSDVIFYLVGLVSYLLNRDRTFLVCGAVVTIVAWVVSGQLRSNIKIRRRVALARRHKALTEGIRCDGKIIAAGKDMEEESYRDLDKNDNMKTYYRRVPNYWVDVEYTDPQSGEKARMHAIHMVRSMEPVIGRAVSVYVWREWSRYSQIELIHTYVDTCDL